MSGVLTLDTFGADFDTTLAIDGFGTQEGTSSLQFDFVPANGSAPANDMFANRSPIPTLGATASGTNVLATAEPGEPNHAESSTPIESIWWSWEAPSGDGLVTFTTAGSDFDTTLAVYTGTSVDNLTLVAFDDDSGPGGTSSLTFEVVPGTVYSVSVDGYSNGKGIVSIDTSFETTAGREANDLFSSSTLITGTSATLIGSNKRAFEEAGEPNHAGFSESIQSVWWHWTAPADGSVSFSTEGSSFDTTLGAYTRDRVGSLTEVASDDDSGGGGTSLVTFDAIAGETYRVAVDGFGNANGAIELTVRFTPSTFVPPSDDATLSDLIVIGGDLDEDFEPNTNRYAIAVPNQPGNIILRPVASDDEATIAVDGEPYDQDGSGITIDLLEGSNTVSILVTAENGDTNEYILTIGRAIASGDANLASLEVSEGELSPQFSSGTQNYLVDVGNSVNNIRLTPSTESDGATVQVDGTSVPSGSKSENISLDFGRNEIEVVVTAENGSTRIYTIAVVREVSSNTKLKDLSLKGAKMKGSFRPTKRNYQATAGKKKKSVKVKLETANPSAKATVNGTKWKKKTKSVKVRLKNKNARIRIRVTAQDGSKGSYRVTVRRK